MQAQSINRITSFCRTPSALPRRGELWSPVHPVWTFALSTVLFTLKNNELLNSLHVIFNIKFIWHPFYFRNTDNNFRSQPFCRRNIYKQHYFYYFSTLKSRHSTLSGYLFCKPASLILTLSLSIKYQTSKFVRFNSNNLIIDLGYTKLLGLSYSSNNSII